MREISAVEWAYAAGILDGEGSIHISWANGSPTIKIALCMNTQEVPNFMHEAFGGRLYVIDTRTGDTYRWQLNGKAAEPFLKGVLPYCLTKRKQAEIGIMFLETVSEKGSGVKNDKTQVLRIKLTDMLTTLNKKRTPVPDWVAPQSREVSTTC